MPKDEIKTTEDKSKWWRGPVLSLFVPAAVFIASAGALYSQVSIIATDMKEMKREMKQEIVEVKTQVKELKTNVGSEIKTISDGVQEIQVKQGIADTKIDVLYEERKSRP